MKDYLSLSIFELHEALIKKEVNPLDLVTLALAKIKSDDNNAVEYICEKEALLMAKKLEQEEPEINNIFWASPTLLRIIFLPKIF